ncbi:MAG: Ig-like domain-containing protein, partial [Pirellula sp.]
VVGTAGAVANSGLITTRTDVDEFRFATQSGNISLLVNPLDVSTNRGNLDVAISLRNSAGTVISTVNEAGLIGTTLAISLPKGFYTLSVDGVGRSAVSGNEGYSDYASIGKYTLSGTVIPNQSPTAVTDSATLAMDQSGLIDVLMNDTDPNSDTLTILSLGAPTVGTVVVEAGKIRFTPPAGYLGTASFSYTISDELGATATGSVSVTVVTNTPPTISVNQASVSGNEGTLITNAGTWADADLPANNVTLSASVGTIVKNANGTWNWQLNSGDQSSATPVVITANDGLGGTATASFSYTVLNVSPQLSATLSAVAGSVLSTITNSGTWSDVVDDTVTLSASVGTVLKNPNGTWTWSYSSPTLVVGQSVTITASDEDAGSSTVSFTMDAFVAVSNRRVFYRGSTYEELFGVDGALETSKSLIKSSSIEQTTSSSNVINYSMGINGLVLDIAGLVNTGLTASDFVFRIAPPGTSGVVTPSNWPNAPEPTLISVTAGTNTVPARVRIEWADEAIQNTWLQIMVKANANTGLTKREVYYVGHAMADVSGTTPYRVTAVDLSEVQSAISTTIVPASDPRDFNKDRRVTAFDLSFVQSRVSTNVLLQDITIPAGDSSGEGEIAKSQSASDYGPQQLIENLSVEASISVDSIDELFCKWNGDLATGLGNQV